MRYVLFNAAKIRRALERSRGAAATEKLVVILMATVIIIPMIAMFGPILAEKFEAVNVLLGGSSNPTLADRPVVQHSNGNWVFLAAFLGFASLFAAVFVAPILFPRARRSRHEALKAIAEKLPFFEPLVDWHAEGMEELHALNQELQDMKPKYNSLKIQAVDLGSVANSFEQTESRGALDLPDMQTYLENDLAAKPMNDLEDATNERAAPPASTFKKVMVGSADDSATIDVGSPHLQSMMAKRRDDLDDDPSLLTSIPIHEIDPSRVRRPQAPAQRYPMADDPDQTIDADSLRGTLKSGLGDADDPDASTQNYNSYSNPKNKY